MNDANTQNDGDRMPVLVLTGKMRRKKHLIYVYGCEVWLLREEFLAICEMVKCKIDDAPATISDKTIRNLRKRIDEAVGQEGIGELLISGPAG